MEVPSEIQHKYMERRRKDLESCLHCLIRQNYVELEKVGHQLKGNGVTFGHEELSKIGVLMEKAAQEKNLVKVEEAIKDFSLWVNQHIN